MGLNEKPVMANEGIRPIKVTAVGDGMVGKTCMLITYTKKQFPQEYVPTVFDNYADNITVDGQKFNMAIWDTAGQEDYERLRPLSYPNTDCFIMCFSISSRSSYENIGTKWYPEIKHFSPTIPIILVGTKMDLRGTEQQDLVTIAEGKQLRRKIKAAMYLECSALTHEGLQDVFVAAVRACMKKPATITRVCTIL